MSPTLLVPWLVVQATATLSQSAVPATGRQETILTLDAPAAVHLSAKSGSGTSCEVIDRVRGPFARAGSTGRTNCELDLLLDAGQYKVRLESPLKGKGQVAIAATLFVELNKAPVQLSAGAGVETKLKPGEQASFWLPMPTRGVPFVRINGRNAGDVRLWRNGEWLEPIALRRASVAHTPGYPMHEWWLDSMVEAGDYLLVVYGRDPVQVTGSTEDDSLTVERSFRPAPPERSVSFTLPVSGVLALELPREPTAAFVSLVKPPDGTVQLQLGEASASSGLSLTNTCTIAKGALVPDCGARASSTVDRRFVLVRGPRGARGTLEWAPTITSGELGSLANWRGGYYGGPSTSFSFTAQASGRAMIGVHDLPVDSDAAPLGCQLESLDGAGVLARSMTVIGEGEGLEKEFNYEEGGALVWFELAAANRYRIRTDGGRKNRCEVYRFKPDGSLERISQTNTAEAPSCDHLLSLGKGQYQVQLFGGNAGIEKLIVREESKRELKKAVARSTCQLPPTQVSVGRYRLTLTRTGAISARGLTFTELPIDPSLAAVHLTLEPKEKLSLPLARTSNFVVRSSGGVPFGCTVPGGSTVQVPECSVPGAGGGETLTLENASALPVQLTVSRPGAVPAMSGLSSYSPQLKPLTRLGAETPAWFDFDRDQTNSALFEVDTPGLYNVTTLGLLSTSCRLRTPVIDLVAENSGGGRGRNCLIQTYLQKGRYLMSATTQGQSRGRGALFLLRRPAKEYPGVSGEGDSFFRVDANELVQQRLVVNRAGDFQLGTTAQGATLMCRLDDPQGWPVETVPSPCVGTRSLGAGTFLWTQLPLTVESMRRTKLERVREKVVLRGNRPHPVQAFTWYDAELGSDGKDEFTFTLEGEATLDVVLTQGMQGRVYRLEKDQAPRAVEVIPPQVTGFDSVEPGEEPMPAEFEGEDRHDEHEYEEPSPCEEDGCGDQTPVAAAASGPAMRPAPPPPTGARVVLPSGSYKLVTEHSKGDVGITYKLHFGSAVLLPGMARSLPVPSTVSLVVPRDGTLRLKTQGEADVRCRLFDERRKLVLEGSDNGSDWNCALAEPVQKGKYTLVLESETMLAGETRLSVALPTVEDKGALTDAQTYTLGEPVLQLSVPPGDTVQELTFKAKGKTPFSCAVVGPEGVATRRSRVTECALLVLPRQEPWFVRVWTTDGTSAVTTSFKSRALVKGVLGQLSGVQALDTTLDRAGRFKTSPQAFCLRGKRTGVLERCGPEVSLEAGPAVFSGFGTPTTPLPEEELRFTASTTPVPFELTRAPHVQRITATQPSLFLLSAQTGWGEAAPPACAFDGPGVVRERRESSCFAVSRIGAEALGRLWAATEATVPAQVVRRDVALPPQAEALVPGRKKVTFNGVGAFGLPSSSRARVEGTLPRDTWAVLLDGTGDALDFCAPTSDLRRCVLTGQGGRLVLVGPSGQAELTTVLLETAPQQVAFTGLYEDAPRTPGTVRLPIAANAEERVLLVEGALRCTLLLATGERLTDCRARIPARTQAELSIDHDVAPLRAIVSAPGRERWAKLGLELPVVSGPALQAATAVPLQQGRLDRTLVLSQSAVVRVAAEGGVCGLFRGNDLLSVDGTDTGCELVRLLNPGTYRLLVRPFAGRPTTGSLRWLAEPVVTLTEGVGAESWLAPGEVRLFTFDTANKGRVGIGLQARSENLDCTVFNDGSQVLGEGCQQYLALEKGRFLLTVRNPNRPGAVPIAVKPVLLGLSGDSNQVPPEYLQDFFGRVGMTP